MRVPISVSLPSIAVFVLILAGCSSSAAGVSGSNNGGAPSGGAGIPQGGAGGATTSSGGVGGRLASAGAATGGANGGESAAGTSAGGVPSGTAGAPSSSGNGGGSAGGGKGGSAGAASGGTGGTGTWSKIPPGTSWQWQLTGKLDTSFAVQVYDIDLFDNDAAAVTALHSKGVKVICYVSVGSYEDWRPDAADFPAAVLGKDYPGWPGEKFLDIRALDTLGPIMQKRLDLCQSKGFDGLEPDNMDVFEGGNSGTGFPLTQKDGLAYAQWLTTQAHARGLSIGQKNTSELADKLAPVMDWALTEDCFDGNWCSDMQPFVDQGKAVLMSEYTDTGVNFGNACTWAKTHQFSAILKGRDLDAPVQFCP